MSTFAPVTLSDGVVVPGIGYGVGTAWYGAEADESGVNHQLVDAVIEALAAGYTHLDNAEAYGNEKSVGAALAESGVARESVFITTKIGTGLNDIRGNFKVQLKQLGVAYVDLYLIHWPYEFGKPGYPTHEEGWKVLEELKDEGLVKSIGVSNYRLSDLEKTLAVARHRPTVNQIELHPYVLKANAPLLAYMEKEGIKVEAYGPTTPLTKFTGGPLDPVLAKITAAVSERAGAKVEPSQVLLRFASQLGAIVVTTSGKDWRMREQLASGAIPALTEEEMAQIKASGDDYHRRRFMMHMDAP